ncbi:ArsB/NhaD family transporter [Klebsiella pneumoniae]
MCWVSLADKGLWAATLGTGFLTAFLSSIMNNMPTVLLGALSIDGSTGKQALLQRCDPLRQRDWLRSGNVKLPLLVSWQRCSGCMSFHRRR